jgi:hypothetical protein
LQLTYGQNETRENFLEGAVRGTNITNQSFSGKASNQTNTLTTNDTQIQQQNRLITYENSSFGFEVDYPMDWQIVNEYERLPDFKNLQLGMLFFSLPHGILQDHNTTFWIETEYLPNRFMPLNKFVDSRLEGLYNGQANVLSRDTIDIAGQTAERVELSCCNSNQSLHEVRIYLINGELGYSLVYSAAPVSFFPLFSADAGNVVESFRLLNSTKISTLGIEPQYAGDEHKQGYDDGCSDARNGTVSSSLSAQSNTYRLGYKEEHDACYNL